MHNYCSNVKITFIFLFMVCNGKHFFLKCTLADIIGGYQEKAFEDKEAGTFGLSFSGKLSN